MTKDQLPAVEERDDPEGSIPKWLGALLSRHEVAKVVANFSGGGDSGQLDDYVFHKESGEILGNDDIVAALEDVSIRDVKTGRVVTGHDIFTEALDTDAVNCGDFYNNDGGSVYLEYEISARGADLTVSDISYFEPDDDDDDLYLDFDDEDDEDLEP